jgi:hypothetical protein
MSEVLSSEGRNDAAAAHFRRFLDLGGVAPRDAREAEVALASGGMVGLIRRNLSRPANKPLDRQGVPFKMASNHAVAGNVDLAFSWLGAALDQRDSQLLFLRVDPRFRALRDDPRFQSILAGIFG